jgi:hypothetical protein
LRHPFELEVKAKGIPQTPMQEDKNENAFLDVAMMGIFRQYLNIRAHLFRFRCSRATGFRAALGRERVAGC